MVEKISVALLLSDLTQVQAITSVFKKLGVIPHFYEDLKTFWKGTLERLPTLCIVDVKKMSEGEWLLYNHPAVIAEQMSLVFFYTNKTEPLLVSTHHFYHLGVLKQSSDYEGPLMAILKRLNKSIEIEQRHLAVQHLTLAQKEKIERLEKALGQEKKVDNFQSMIKDVCLEFEKLRNEADFFTAVEKVFRGVEEIEEFAFLELSLDGQRLISPITQSSKFKNIPPIRPGHASLQGIDLVTQNIAEQTAMEFLGGNLVSLLIKGISVNPDKLIYIKTKSELFYNHFDWNMLEAYLNGFYAILEARLIHPITNSKRFESNFLAMSYVDQFLFGQASAESNIVKSIPDMRLVDLDLASLLEVVLKKPTNRFFWARFEKELINKLEIQSRVHFKFFSFGVNNIGFMVEALDLDVFFDELKDFAARFPYWKYFEETEGILTQVIQPRVTMSPLSAHAYLMKTLKSEGEVKEMLIKEQKSNQKKLWALIGPQNYLDN